MTLKLSTNSYVKHNSTSLSASEIIYTFIQNYPAEAKVVQDCKKVIIEL